MTIVSGIQPSGRLHVGNALGAVQNWIALQQRHGTIPHPPSPPLSALRRTPKPAGGGETKGGCFFFLADWHSLTEEYDPTAKAGQVRELAAELMALGVGGDAAVLFRQSDIPEHLELAWYLTCVTPAAELQRMTQYKDKVGHGESPNVGLFTYPVLMAADILAYSKPQADRRKPTAIGVPVGDDQRQHLELTNDIVRWFNNRYGETFPEVAGLHTPTARVMSLKDPTRKMSKSAGADHCLFLDDAPDVVMKKIKTAVTDTQPQAASCRMQADGVSVGVQTLFTILEAYGDADTVARFRRAHEEGTIKYAELKPAVAEAFIAAHADFRKRKAELMGDTQAIDAALARGAEAARAVARATLDIVRTRVGIAA